MLRYVFVVGLLVRHFSMVLHAGSLEAVALGCILPFSKLGAPWPQPSVEVFESFTDFDDFVARIPSWLQRSTIAVRMNWSVASGHAPYTLGLAYCRS
jgi:hypothetical protein